MLEQKFTKFKEIFSFFEVEVRYFSVYRLWTTEKDGFGGIRTKNLKFDHFPVRNEPSLG